jgi:hypothetical protein
MLCQQVCITPLPSGGVVAVSYVLYMFMLLVCCSVCACVCQMHVAGVVCVDLTCVARGALQLALLRW